MIFKSINPYSGKELATHSGLTESQLDEKLKLSHTAFQTWRNVILSERTKLIIKAGQILRNNADEYARMITLEMGKPISESREEINKCAWVCDYYAENASAFLQDEIIETDAQKSFVRHEPLGTVLAIMPWNFPFWQVFRFAAPTLLSGNTALLKHAPNVFGCAQLIENIFNEAGFPKGVFQNLIVHHDETEKIIAHISVQAVTLTGSEKAGSTVATLAGKHIKKSVLELGGNNAYIVCEDADIDKAVETAVVARMLNTGQSCIAAKRFILEEGIYNEFVSKFKDSVSRLISGDPMKETTQIGTLARKDLADHLQKQIQDSIALGAELLLGGNQNECYHQPTILGNVTPEMSAFSEETFGPLAAIIKAKNLEEAIALSQQSKYGLGVSVFTKDVDKALSFSHKINDGAFFINEMVKSDPRLPFGGTKLSGYGRELSKEGILEFVNRKTIYVAK